LTCRKRTATRFSSGTSKPSPAAAWSSRDALGMVNWRMAVSEWGVVFPIAIRYFAWQTNE
jgi:hypothetical protein